MESCLHHCCLPWSWQIRRKVLRQSPCSAPELAAAQHGNGALGAGLVLPTTRQVETFSMALPSNLVITSPASTPALAAGESGSTADTRAPSGLPRPMDSATPWSRGRSAPDTAARDLPVARS
jgi:hypothetical protein